METFFDFLPLVVVYLVLRAFTRAGQKAKRARPAVPGGAASADTEALLKLLGLPPELLAQPPAPPSSAEEPARATPGEVFYDATTRFEGEAEPSAPLESTARTYDATSRFEGASRFEAGSRFDSLPREPPPAPADEGFEALRTPAARPAATETRVGSVASGRLPSTAGPAVPRLQSPQALREALIAQVILTRRPPSRSSRVASAEERRAAFGSRPPSPDG